MGQAAHSFTRMFGFNDDVLTDPIEPIARVEMLRRTSQAVAPLHKQSLGMDELKNAFINPEAHGFARLSRRISTYA